MAEHGDLQPSTTNGEPIEQPRAPNPSLDPGVVPSIGDSIDADKDVPQDENFDVSSMEPIVAMKMLSRGVQALVDITGDVPPTPPVSRPTTPDSAALQSQRPRTASSRPTTPSSAVPSHDIKAPSFRNVEIGSPEAHLAEPTVVIGEGAVRVKTQYEAVARKFFSKKPPPISVDDYLMRLHRYCPMSTAVYLAAGLYIYKLGVEDKLVPITSRTVHRLLLGTLRIAMKALEDLSYPHQRFAGVGGVSERELAKLEVSVCYLMSFNLKVDNAMLYDKTRSLQQAAKTMSRGGSKMRLQLPHRDKASRRRTVT